IFRILARDRDGKDLPQRLDVGSHVEDLFVGCVHGEHERVPIIIDRADRGKVFGDVNCWIGRCHRDLHPLHPGILREDRGGGLVRITGWSEAILKHGRGRGVRPHSLGPVLAARIDERRTEAGLRHAGRLRGNLHVDDRIQTHQGPPAFMATSTVAIPSTTSETEDARAKRSSIWRRSVNASSCKNDRSWIGVASMNDKPTLRSSSSTDGKPRLERTFCARWSAVFSGSNVSPFREKKLRERVSWCSPRASISTSRGSAPSGA